MTADARAGRAAERRQHGRAGGPDDHGVLQAAGTTVDLDAEQHAEHVQDRALIARCNSAKRATLDYWNLVAARARRCC